MTVIFYDSIDQNNTVQVQNDMGDFAQTEEEDVYENDENGNLEMKTKVSAATNVTATNVPPMKNLELKSFGVPKAKTEKLDLNLDSAVKKVAANKLELKSDLKSAVDYMGAKLKSKVRGTTSIAATEKDINVHVKENPLRKQNMKYINIEKMIRLMDTNGTGYQRQINIDLSKSPSVRLKTNCFVPTKKVNGVYTGEKIEMNSNGYLFTYGPKKEMFCTSHINAVIFAEIDDFGLKNGVISADWLEHDVDVQVICEAKDDKIAFLRCLTETDKMRYFALKGSAFEGSLSNLNLPEPTTPLSFHYYKKNEAGPKKINTEVADIGAVAVGMTQICEVKGALAEKGVPTDVLGSALYDETKEFRGIVESAANAESMTTFIPECVFAVVLKKYLNQRSDVDEYIDLKMDYHNIKTQTTDFGACADFFGIPEKDTGLRVMTDIRQMKEDDIIMEINGYKISSKGTITLKPFKNLDQEMEVPWGLLMSVLTQRRPLLKMKVWRNNAKKTLSHKCDYSKELISRNASDISRDFMILAGSCIRVDDLAEMLAKMNLNDLGYDEMEEYTEGRKLHERDEAIVLNVKEGTNEAKLLSAVGGKLITHINHMPVFTLSDVIIASTKPLERNGRKFFKIRTHDNRVYIKFYEDYCDLQRKAGNLRDLYRSKFLSKISCPKCKRVNPDIKENVLVCYKCNSKCGNFNVNVKKGVNLSDYNLVKVTKAKKQTLGPFHANGPLERTTKCHARPYSAETTTPTPQSRSHRHHPMHTHRRIFVKRSYVL